MEYLLLCAKFIDYIYSKISSLLVVSFVYWIQGSVIDEAKRHMKGSHFSSCKVYGIFQDMWVG